MSIPKIIHFCWLSILAAVAVPKLFGMIAKSKASEIGPAAASVELSAGKTNAWQASNKGALNDCTVNSSWVINVVKNETTGGSAVYNGTISSTDCSVLIPSFKNIVTGTFSDGSGS